MSQPASLDNFTPQAMDMDPGSFEPATFGEESTPEPAAEIEPAPAPEPTPEPESEEAPSTGGEEEAPSTDPLDPANFEPETFGEEPPAAEAEPEPEPEPEAEPEPEESEGIANLRRQYNETKAERDQLSTQISDMQARESEALAKATRLEAENKELRSKVSKTDVAQHPEVQAITQPFIAEVNGVARDLAINGAKEAGNYLKSNIGGLARQYNAIGDPDSEGFDDRSQAFNDTLEERFGTSNDANLRGLITRAAAIVQQADAKVKELQTNESAIAQEMARNEHREVMKRYSEEIEPAWTPTQELIDSDPMNPLVIIHNTIKAGGDDFKKRDENTRRFIRYTSTPLPPVSDQELAGKSDAEVSQLLEAKAANYAQAIDNRDKLAYVGFMSMQFLPAFYQRMVKAEALAKKVGTSLTPPAPDGNADTKPVSTESLDDSPKDPRTFEPVGFGERS